MTKKQAQIQMDLLKLNFSRVREEIKQLQAQFCGRNKHYFLTANKQCEAAKEPAVKSRLVCVFCRLVNDPDDPAPAEFPPGCII